MKVLLKTHMRRSAGLGKNLEETRSLFTQTATSEEAGRNMKTCEDSKCIHHHNTDKL